MNSYFVFLRRPHDLNDRRNDPFWEFGSFGRTGCHKANLLHPRSTPLRTGDRLVFLQGGNGEIRVIGISPPLRLGGTDSFVEVTWDPNYRPVSYESAPLLINNKGETDFEKAKDYLKDANRETWCGKAGSKLRSRTTPIESELDGQILKRFSDNFPRIEDYPEAIEPRSSRWYMHASDQGWGQRTAREAEFRKVGKAMGLVDAATPMPGLKSKRHC